MKKLLFILLISITVNAQPYVGVLGDVRNATIGSEQTNNCSKLNYIIKAGVIGYDSVPFKAGVSYERFDAIAFEKWAVELGWSANMGRIFNKEIHFEPSLELFKIDRKELHISSVSLGVNLETKYYLTKNIAIDILYQITDRKDIDKIVASVFLGVNWRFNKHTIKY